jgi:MATE family multidrug resistance protein
VWFSLATAPLFAFMAWIASDLFRWADQPAELIPLESIYFRLLMLGSVGSILESALGGFFSGTERSSTVMYVSITAGLMNIVLDWWLIFGVGPFPELGIAGAAIASSLSFWFKALCFAGLLLRKPLNEQYQFLSGMSFDPKRLWTLLYFGSPTGLVFLNEAAGFSLIVLRIGRLGDIPLRATTMAINFNMIAFIPLVGVSIATSVLVGRRLVESGPASAKQCVIAALAIGWIYSAIWGGGYLWVPDWMLSLYAFESATEDSFEAISLATGLLWFVALYVLLDATQLILAGALRGAGDTWFVLLNGFIMTAFTLTVGLVGEPATEGLTWWWWMVTLWVWLLAMGMTARYLQGRWQFMRMV